MISDIALVTKTGKGRVVSLVVNRQTGEPIPRREGVDAGARPLADEATTNNDGIAEFPVEGRDGPPRSA